MKILQIIEKKTIKSYIESYALMERFIKLPWYVKIIISPLLLILFFFLIFPIIIIFGLLYKILSLLANGLKEIFINRILIFTIIKFLVISFVIIIISSFILLLLFGLYIQIIYLLPVILLKLICFIISPYILLVFLINNNKSVKILRELIKSDDTLENIEEYKEAILKESGNKASLNPLLLFSENPFTIMIAGTLNFAGSLLSIIIIGATINKAFPSIFFNGIGNLQDQLHFWLIYIFDQLLIVIPVDILAPFLPNNTGEIILQPWGGLLSIIFQIFIAFTMFQYFRTLIYSAKYSIQLKINKNTCSNSKGIAHAANHGHKENKR